MFKAYDANTDFHGTGFDCNNDMVQELCQRAYYAHQKLYIENTKVQALWEEIENCSGYVAYSLTIQMIPLPDYLTT